MYSEEQDKDIWAVTYNFYKKYKYPPEDVTKLKQDFDRITQKYNSVCVNFTMIGWVDEIKSNYKLKYKKNMPFEVD